MIKSEKTHFDYNKFFCNFTDAGYVNLSFSDLSDPISKPPLEKEAQSYTEGNYPNY